MLFNLYIETISKYSIRNNNIINWYVIIYENINIVIQYVTIYKIKH